MKMLMRKILIVKIFQKNKMIKKIKERKRLKNQKRFKTLTNNQKYKNHKLKVHKNLIKNTIKCTIISKKMKQMI